MYSIVYYISWLADGFMMKSHAFIHQTSSNTPAIGRATRSHNESPTHRWKIGSTSISERWRQLLQSIVPSRQTTSAYIISSLHTDGFALAWQTRQMSKRLSPTLHKKHQERQSKHQERHSTQIVGCRCDVFSKISCICRGRSGLECATSAFKSIEINNIIARNCRTMLTY